MPARPRSKRIDAPRWLDARSVSARRLQFCPGRNRAARTIGLPAKSILLVGQAGGSPWPHFLRWRARSRSELPTRSTLGRAQSSAPSPKSSAPALSPVRPALLPFQQWAMRAEGLKPSPLGILMHPQYGLWHAYRGALLFDVEHCRFKRLRRRFTSATYVSENLA